MLVHHQLDDRVYSKKKPTTAELRMDGLSTY